MSQPRTCSVYARFFAAARAAPARGAGHCLALATKAFGFSRAETRGLVLLLLAMLAVAVVPILLRPTDPVYLPAADQQQLDSWATDLSARLARTDSAERLRYAERRSYGPGRTSRYPQVAQVKLSPFDPNILSATDWEARGVPHFVAGRIVNYGQKAGGFRAKAQVQRVYGLPDSVYQRLAPFMQLPDALPARPDYAAARAGAAYTPGAASRFARKPAHLQPFDLNQADTTQLQQIKGIGHGRAKYIVQRRNELGGYTNEAQLADVFVLRDAPDPGRQPAQVHLRGPRLRTPNRQYQRRHLR